ncbi:secretion HlyD domain protein [Burkholderia pseudomallei]|nr:secretion HlyD domain protein [Burkholderia pseudomallei]
MRHLDGPHRDRVAGADHIDEAAVRPDLDRVLRHRRRVAQHVDDGADHHRLPGPQRAVGILEHRFHPDHAAGRIDAVLDRAQAPMRERRLAVRAHRDGLDLAAPQRRLDRRQRILRFGIDRGDRRSRDEREQRRIVGLHEVALVDEPKADAPRDGRADRRVIDGHAGVLHGGLIAADLRMQLVDARFPCIQHLHRRRVHFGEPLMARELEPGVGERRLVLLELRCRLVGGRLERAAIDLDEHVARAHLLAFAEPHMGDLAVDLASHGHVVLRRDGADAG